MGNSAVVGLLRVLLSMNTAEFDAAAKRASSSARVWSKDLNQIGRQATQIGSALTKTLTLPLLAVGAAFVKVGKDFDEARDSIRAATGATGKSLDALSASFKKVLGTVPSSLGDVATAIGDLSTRTGATGDRLEGLATQVLNLARVSKSDLSAVIAATTRAFGDWSISTDKQSGALDFLWKTSQATGIGVTRLTELVVQFGAPLRALGFSFEESAALMGKWEKEGVNLETVLAGLRFALGNFAKAGKEPAAALREVQAAILGAKTESEATAIAFKNFGKRAAVDMGRAIIEGRFNIDDLVKSLKTSTETINQTAKDTRSLGEKFGELRNRAMVAAEPIGTVLVNALEHALDVLQPVLRLAEGLAHAFAALPGPVQGTIVAIAALVAAVGPAIWLFGRLTSTAGLVIGAFTKQGIAARGLAAAHAVLIPSVRGLAGVLAGAGGLVAALGAAAVAYTLIKTNQIRAQANAMFEASAIVKQAITNLADAQKILDAFAAGKTGQKLTGAVTMEMAAAWEAGAKSVRQLGQNAAVTDDQIGATSLTLAGFGKTAQATLPPAEKSAKELAKEAKTLKERFREFNEVLETDRKKTEAYQETLAKADQSLQDMWRSSITATMIDAKLHDEFDRGTFIINRQIASLKERASLLNLKGGSATELITEITSPIPIGKIVDPTKGAALGGAVASAVLGALQGGGNPLAAAGGAAGSQLLGSLAKKMTSGAGMAIGGILGGALNTALPIIGSLAGPLLDKVFGKLFKTEGKQVNDARDQFLAQFGGFHELAAKLHDLGPAGDALFQRVINAKKMKEFEAATKDVTAALEKQDQRVGAFNTHLTGFLTRLKDLGGALPETLREYLAKLAEGKGLTQENIDLLKELSSNGEVDWRKIQDAVNRYGGDIEKLGGTFQAARLHDGWKQLIDDMDLFERGGVSAGDILGVVKGKIIELVNQSVKFGTEIPENMRPWIEKLIDSGELVDENGTKITDIGKLKFGETLQTSIQELKTAVMLLVDEFKKIPGAVAEIPSNITTRVTVRRRFVEDDGESETATAARGGLVTARGIQYRSLGGPIWRARGTDTVRAMLTPGELILTEADQGIIARGLEAARSLMHSGALDAAGFIGGRAGATVQGGGRPIILHNYTHLDGREVARNQVRYFAREAVAAGV